MRQSSRALPCCAAARSATVPQPLRSVDDGLRRARAGRSWLDLATAAALALDPRGEGQNPTSPRGWAAARPLIFQAGIPKRDGLDGWRRGRGGRDLWSSCGRAGPEKILGGSCCRGCGAVLESSPFQMRSLPAARSEGDGICGSG